MPTYEYRCIQCENQLEVIQGFNDAALTECPSCSGQLRKVFGNVGVVFKGSGFYRNDSRKAKASSVAPSAKPSATTSESSAPSSPSKTASPESASTPKSAAPKAPTASKSASSTA